MKSEFFFKKFGKNFFSVKNRLPLTIFWSEIVSVIQRGALKTVYRTGSLPIITSFRAHLVIVLKDLTSRIVMHKKLWLCILHSQIPHQKSKQGKTLLTLDLTDRTVQCFRINFLTDRTPIKFELSSSIKFLCVGTNIDLIIECIQIPKMKLGNTIFAITKDTRKLD